MSRKVLVIGGTGFFGRLLVDDLLRYIDCDLIIGSRPPLHSNRVPIVMADLSDPGSLERALAGVNVAICAAGPYQQLPTTLAKLCLQREIHYIDLADDRGFVQRVRSVAAEHDGSLSAVCTAWSTVSALSGLLSSIGIGGMGILDSIHIHMAPGNRGARQAATVASLLYSVGQPFPVFREGDWQMVTGWSEPRDYVFPSPVGKRRGYLVDVPDHDIFPQLFNARTVEFRAGAELECLNRCVSLLSHTRRSWVRWSGALQRAAALLSWIGHGSGAIGVEVSGSSRRRLSILAESTAQRIAVMPASVMTARLLSGFRHRGLVSHRDWLSEDELRRECERRGFRFLLEEL